MLSQFVTMPLQNEGTFFKKEIITQFEPEMKAVFKYFLGIYYIRNVNSQNIVHACILELYVHN